MDVKHALPLLPLRDIVIFPSMVIPLFVGRDKSISSLNEVMKDNKKIILVTQKNSEVDDPKKTDVFTYGCESNILQLLKLPDGTVKVLVEGIKRVKIIDFKNDNLSLNISGSGNITGNGEVETLVVKINGSGNLMSKEIKSKSATITINGSGDAEVFASDSISAKINGSGNIEYFGNPENVDSIINGSGDINSN